MPSIRPISDLRNSANEISDFCHQTQEPVFITRVHEKAKCVQLMLRPAIIKLSTSFDMSMDSGILNGFVSIFTGIAGVSFVA